MSDSTLAWLRNRAEVTDAVLRFANAMDRQDWTALRACLADELLEIDTAGHYRHGLARAGPSWRIDRIVQTVLWSRGNPDVHGALRART